MNPIRVTVALLMLAGVVLAAGCAANPQTAALQGPGKDLAKQWSKAAKEPADIEDTKPEPEPKLLPMTHFTAGNLLEKQGSYTQAIEQYRKAVELNTTFAAAYGRLGLCYMKLGQHDPAIQALRRATELQQPASAQLWNNLGFAYLARKDYPQAERCLSKALEVKPAFARARLNLAIVLVQLNRDGEALGHLQAIVPEPIAYYNLGAMQLAAGRPAASLTAFERVLSLQSDFPAARKGLDESLARLAKIPAAPHAPSLLPDPATAGGPTPVRPADPKKVVLPEPAQADAAPATRPIAGIDDEPAVANAPADCTPAAVPAAQDVLQVVAIDLPSAASFACVRTVVFTDETGRTLRWPIAVTSATTVAAQSVAPIEPAELAMIEEVVCQATSRSVAAPAGVVDMDLASLRWAAWSDAVVYLGVDVGPLSSEDLRKVLGKWLSALNELESVTPTTYGVTAYADDM